ncbi:SDR family oxidoreductase [Egicoccus sp. AB-alg2]|uniref:SDR family oxidoreductase n=1 Tax=Egicoccus sp. AB-alg2 TaxID=3242693 RepID=UPI00359E74E5
MNAADDRPILVTGAGGKTGRAVLRALVDAGAPARALLRGPDRLADAPGLHGTVETVVGDQRDRDDLEAALDGVAAVYAIAPNLHPDEVVMGRALVDACRRRGLTRVVYHSVIHPQVRAMPHHADKGRVEELLVTSDLDWTILQPNAYLQNLRGYVDGLRDGVYAVPYATDRRLAMVDLDEVAEVAARCLVEGLGVHASFELSGPAEVSADDVAAAAARALGRPVTAVRRDPATWVAGQSGLCEETRRRLLAMLTAYDQHGSPGDATVLGALLGRAPRGLDDVLPALLA